MAARFAAVTIRNSTHRLQEWKNGKEEVATKTAS